MAFLHQIDKWSTTHPRLLLLLRAALGIALTSKGISFISDMMAFKALLAESSFGFLPDWIALVVTWIHLLCGFLITIGLFTRLSALIQIPILIGAVIINASTGIFTPGSELIFSLVILVLLIFFVFEGGGELSLDRFIKTHLL
ncbi:MAG TPA: DoxX family protein [Chitinophagaceae bacterium]|nr:DoxX family protein [Chitinophagaceae bacterium]